jgi:uncharacterized protein YlaI
MANVHYVRCPLCRKEYYIDRTLYDAVLANPAQVLVCPFCKNRFCHALTPKS